MSSTTTLANAYTRQPVRAAESAKLRHLRSGFLNVFRDEDAATAVEYAVMVAMIAVACIAAVNLMSSTARDSFQNSAEAIGQ